MCLIQKNIKSFLLFVVSCSVSATEVNYSADIIVSKYSNLNLEQNPLQGETTESIRGAISITESSASLAANLDASLETINYINNQVRDESQGGLIANVRWVIVPDRYEWYISDTYTQTLSNPFVSDTPGNRQNVNAFSTGPDVIWRASSRHYLNLSARLENISFESSQFVANADNDRLEVSTGWRFQLEAATSLSLNYVVEMVDFDDDVANSNYDRSDVYLALNHQRGMNVFGSQVGITKVNNENSEDENETRFGLSLLSTRTRTSTLEIKLNRNITDASSELLDQVLVETGSESSVTDIYLDKSASLVYNKALISGNFSLDLSRSDADYRQLNQLDQIEKSVLMNASWHFQRSSQLALVVQYANSVFDNVSREDDDYLYSLQYTYNARRYISVNLEVASQKRKSTDYINNYDDSRIILSLTYNSR